MATLDLNTLSLGELKQLQKDVGRAIASYEERQKAAARAKVEALAKELGYSLPELASSTAPRTPAAAKYRHPENPALTWAGRGRQPKWFAAALAAGMTPEDLAIG